MKAKYIVIFLLSLLSFVACDKEEVVIPTTAPRTVLIYFAGDNSLSGYVSQNLRAIKKGIERDGLNNGNLLIYTDKQNEAPQLFQLKVEADTIRQIVLETYDSNQNSASTETLTQIIDKVQKEYPADSAARPAPAPGLQPRLYACLQWGISCLFCSELPCPNQ